MSYYEHIPDHPVIRNMELTGYPDGKEPEYPHCPSCHAEETTEIYVNKDGDVGCGACITRKDAEGVPSFTPDGDGVPVCPSCGRPCEYAYLDRDGGVFGCDECVSEKDAWDREDCFWPKGRRWD